MSFETYLNHCAFKSEPTNKEFQNIGVDVVEFVKNKHVVKLYFVLSKTLDTINQRFFWNKTVFGFSNDNRMSVIGEKKKRDGPKAM